MGRDPSLVVDETGVDEKLDQPGLHALLIGVSRYPYVDGGDPASRAQQTYGFGQLDGPARTVRDLSDTLVSLRDSLTPPLKTLRVLASPSPSEAGIDGPSNGVGPLGRLCDRPSATLANVSEAADRWRSDASRNPADATLFYFAGHGLQRTRTDSVLLLEDFLAPGEDLARTLEVNNLYYGMGNKSAANIARTQFFFIDACRSVVEGLRAYVLKEGGGVFRVELDALNDRVAPIINAAVAGSATFGHSGGLSLFGRDLIACLEGAAADCVNHAGSARWVLNVGTLITALTDLADTWNKANATASPRRPDPDVRGASLSTTLRVYAEPPAVECTFSLDPNHVWGAVEPALTDASGQPVLPGFPLPWNGPFNCVLRAGNYTARASMQDGQALVHAPEIIILRPPTRQYTFHMRAG